MTVHRAERALASPIRRGPMYRLGIFLAALLAGGVLVGAVLSVLAQQGIMKQRDHGVLQPIPMLLTGVLAVALVIGVTSVVVRRLEQRDLSAIGLWQGGWRMGLPVGVLCGAIVPALAALVLQRLGIATITPTDLTALRGLRESLPMLGAIAFLSTWEEFAFRGYPLQLLRESYGPWVATGVTGLLFGLVHAGNPGANPLGLVLTAANGMLLGWIVLRSRSLWIACGYHVGWNVMASLVLGMRDSGIVTPGSLFSTTLNGSRWVTGGEYGFEASVVTGALELLLLGLLVRMAPRLPGAKAGG